MIQGVILTQDEINAIEYQTKMQCSIIREMFDRTLGALDHCDISIFSNCCDLTERINKIRKTIGLDKINF